MGLDIGRLLRNVLSGGSTYFRDQREGKKEEQRARDLIAQNTQLAQGLYDRDLGESEWNSQEMQDALRRLERVADQGFTDLDRQALDQSFMQSRQESQGQSDAALSAAARRGDASGGNALLASLMAEQGGANRSAQYATDLGLAGRDRSVQANLARTGLLGQQAQGNDSFRQWATGQQMNAAGMLMNARTGQAQSMQEHGQQLQASPNADAIAQAYLAYQTGGASGGLGSAASAGNTSGQAGKGTQGASQGTYSTGAGGGAKSMGALNGQPEQEDPQGARQYVAARRVNTFGRGVRPQPQWRRGVG